MNNPHKRIHAKTSLGGGLVVSAILLGFLALSGCQLPKVTKEPVQDIASPSIGAGLADSKTTLAAAPALNPETPGFLKMGHYSHAIEQEIECEACHEIDSRGRPSMPDHEVCATCHDIDIDEPDEECMLCHVLSPADVAAEAYENVEVIHAPESGGFQFDHSAFSGDSAVCAKCHDEAMKSSQSTDNLRGDHASLFPGVREQGGDTTNCTLCHIDMNRTAPPSSHQAPNFLNAHGNLYRNDPNLCLNCHTQNQCDTCHQNTKPQSHYKNEWRHSHGKVGQFDEQKCMMCHNENACTSCHSQEMPRDHTNFFRTRSHGKIASWDRDRCLVCHKQDYCQACHLGAAPGIPPEDFHRPGTPCLVCHSPASAVRPLRRHGPLPEASCLNCHQFQ
jgi:hypothetical protein